MHLIDNKYTATIEVTPEFIDNFVNDIPELRKAFRNYLKEQSLPVGGINIQVDENGIIEVSVNSGFTNYKNTYRKDIMKIIPESITKGWDAKETLLSKCLNLTRFKKAMIQDIFQRITGKDTCDPENKIDALNYCAIYCWLSIPIAKRENFVQTAVTVLQQLVDTIDDWIYVETQAWYSYYQVKYPVGLKDDPWCEWNNGRKTLFTPYHLYRSMIDAIPTMSDIQDDFDEFKDEEAFFTGVEADDDHPDYDDGLYPPFAELNSENVVYFATGGEYGYLTSVHNIYVPKPDVTLYTPVSPKITPASGVDMENDEEISDTERRRIEKNIIMYGSQHDNHILMYEGRLPDEIRTPSKCRRKYKKNTHLNAPKKNPWKKTKTSRRNLSPVHFPSLS